MSGSFSAGVFPLLGGSAGVLAIVGCYWLSQVYHHEKPFPHTWISATADHYPEFVLFRLGTISGAVFLLLSAFITYFWLLQLGLENTMRVKRLWPQVGLVLGIMGALALMGSTANLDTGKHNTNWHVACAVSFFLFSIFSHVYNTVVVALLHLRHCKGLSPTSTLLKVILAVLTLAQMYVDLTHHNSPVLSNTLEYSLAFSILAFNFIAAYDVRDFAIVYTK